MSPSPRREPGGSVPQELINIAHQSQVDGDGCFGRGLDYYAQDIAHEYSDAYAYFGRGFVTLLATSKDPVWLDRAAEAADWLLQHRFVGASPTGAPTTGWGLPWAYAPYQGSEIPAGEPFTITTVIAGHLMMDMYEVTGDEKYKTAAEEVGRWLLETCGTADGPHGAGFLYAAVPSVTDLGTEGVSYNVHSEAIGFLARLNESSPDDGCVEAVSRGLALLESKQDPDGLWPYADRNPRREHHQCMVLLGLLRVHDSGLESESLVDMISRGSAGTWEVLFDHRTGRGRIQDVRDQPMWLQFAALHALALWKAGTAIGDERFRRWATTVMSDIASEYRIESGRYGLTPEDTKVFVRPTAQLFYVGAELFAAGLEVDWTTS